MKNETRINPLDGVGKSDEIVIALKRLKAGVPDAASYIRGVIKFYERKPPNEVLIPVLKKALGVYK